MSTAHVKDETIPIVMISSDYYVPYTYVTMKSIIMNTKRRMSFYILTTDIQESSKRLLGTLNHPIEYIYINVDQYPAPKMQRWYRATFAKTMLHTLLPHVDKALVLDSDIIVTCDVAEIYDIDLSDNYVAWVRDPIDVFSGKETFVNKFNIQKQYINSGVMLVNLEAWRRDDIGEVLLNNWHKYIESIVAYEQDVLYITLSSKCVYIDYVYNYIPTLNYMREGVNEYCDNNYKIIHWGLDKKPWNNPSIKLGHVWWSYARQTPIYELLIWKETNAKILNLQETNKKEAEKHTRILREANEKIAKLQEDCKKEAEAHVRIQRETNDEIVRLQEENRKNEEAHSRTKLELQKLKEEYTTESKNRIKAQAQAQKELSLLRTELHASKTVLTVMQREVALLPINWLNMQRCHLAQYLIPWGKLHRHYISKKRKLREQVRRTISFLAGKQR